MRKFNELTKNELIEAIQEVEYLGQVLQVLGAHDNTSNRKKLREFIEENGIDASHIKSKTTRSKYELNPKRCKYCNEVIPYEKRQNDFCSHSCAASYNNLGTVRNGTTLPAHSYCLNCGKEITRGNSYCNNTCRAEYERKEYIRRWKAGEESGTIGTDNTAAAVKYYLREKYNNSCQRCGWNEVNPYTGLVPLQIHHIDGDCTNNREENLQLLCPNCHSLTENFGSRNKNCTRIDKRVR